MNDNQLFKSASEKLHIDASFGKMATQENGPPSSSGQNWNSSQQDKAVENYMKQSQKEQEIRAKQAQSDFQDEKMKDALNYANLIQNVENIGRMNSMANNANRNPGNLYSSMGTQDATAGAHGPS